MEGDPSNKKALKAKKGGTRNYLRTQMHGLFVKPIICNKLIKYIMITSNSHPYKRQHPSNMRMLLGAPIAMALLITSAASANEIDLQIKTASKQLAVSIRAFATGTSAASECLVKSGQLSKKIAKETLPLSLLEVGISPEVLNNPQVIKATSILSPTLNADCTSTKMSIEAINRLIKDEL
ncbi:MULTISPECIES: glutamyl-tRNA amidotransferase [unclassified Prochlorococcus]|uniref:glutamyl-tRNA amidotransferase n=1 Tax=unclassified Prochlorococcus TaxID=2627481 RepID=UPI000A56E6FB|nr:MULTISPECIES: glutamyl-tRNA amidotransferase [unclassified Prochlorococcus]